MPHLIVEYSANVADHHDIDGLVEAMHQAAIDSEIGAMAAMRTRAVERQFYRIADGSGDFAFIATIARIGPGRDAATKKSFVTHMLDRAQQHIKGEGSDLSIAWSMEVQEIDAEFRINRNEVVERIKERSTDPVT